MLFVSVSDERVCVADAMVAIACFLSLFVAVERIIEYRLVSEGRSGGIRRNEAAADLFQFTIRDFVFRVHQNPSFHDVGRWC